MIICVYAWMLQKKKISGSQRTQAEPEMRRYQSHTFFSGCIVFMLQLLCLVEPGIRKNTCMCYVSEIWAVWDAELVLFYILNKPPSQSLYSSFERERDKLPNQETCHTSPEGSSSLLTRVGCDAHETLNYSLKDHRVLCLSICYLLCFSFKVHFLTVKYVKSNIGRWTTT